jgi:cytokinin dehydrogenase
MRVFYLLYDDVETWLADQRAMIESGRFDYLEGFCSSSAQGTRHGLRGREPFYHWFYGVHAGIEYEPGEEPDDAAELEGLRPYRVVHVEDDDPIGFASLFDSRRERAQRAGADARVHPWLDALLPAGVLPELLPRLLDSLPPSLGDGHRVIFLSPRDLPRFFVVPPGDDITCFSILPRGVSPAVAGDTLDVVRATHEAIVRAGGKRYLPGWLGMMDAAAWRAHYGDRYDAWAEAKRHFDPRGVLTSALFQEIGA